MGKQKMRFIFKGILASLLAVFFMVPMVYAQDDEDTFTLEEITVTAEKRETDLQKTPLSIQTVSGVELVTEAKRRIDEIMQGVVGVSSQGSQVGTSFFMRGLGNAALGPGAGLSQSAVAVLIDGVYQNRGEVVRGGTLDMAQAEVMRGTQSTTLGGSSLAGAVSLVSNDPVFKYEGSGSLGIGNYDLLTTQGVLNVPLTENQAARVAFSSEKRDGYISSNAGNSNQTNARIKYRWQPTDALNIVATFNHQIIGGNGVDASVLTYAGYWEGYDESNSDNYDATMGDPALFGHVDGVTYENRDDPWDDGYPADQWPNDPFRDTKIDQYSADIDWDLGIGTLTLTPSYQTAHFRSMEPPRGNRIGAEDRKQETTQLDAQLTSPNDAPFEWLGGIYYYDTSFSGAMLNTFINGQNAGPTCPSDGERAYCWNRVDPNTQTSYSAYGNLSYPIIEDLRLNAGLRYTHDEKTYRSASATPGTMAGPYSDYVYNRSGEAEWSDVTYRVGTEYDLTDQAMLYVMYATGYQPGAFPNNEPSEKQTLGQWTAGLKSRWFRNRVQVNVEGFHSTYHNRPMKGSLTYYSDAWSGGSTCGGQGPGADPYTYNSDTDNCYTINRPTVPDLVSTGADVEINWLITENDRLDGSVEYLQSTQGVPDLGLTQSDLEGDDFAPTAAAAAYNGLAGLASDYDGLTLQNSPEWSANATYSHIFDLPNGSTVTPKINAEYRGSYWSQGGGPGGNTSIVQPGDSVQDAYTLWNAYLNWTSSDDKFNISAYVKNIENKPILTNFGDEAGMQYVMLAPPRTFGVVLSIRL